MSGRRTRGHPSSQSRAAQSKRAMITRLVMRLAATRANAHTLAQERERPIGEAASLDARNLACICLGPGSQAFLQTEIGSAYRIAMAPFPMNSPRSKCAHTKNRIYVCWIWLRTPQRGRARSFRSFRAPKIEEAPIRVSKIREPVCLASRKPGPQPFLRAQLYCRDRLQKTHPRPSVVSVPLKLSELASNFTPSVLTAKQAGQRPPPESALRGRICPPSQQSELETYRPRQGGEAAAASTLWLVPAWTM